MPQKDRTFSHCDVIRIYQDHLEPDEQVKVAIYFRFLILDDVLNITEITLPILKELIESINDFTDFIEVLFTKILKVKNKAVDWFIKRVIRRLQYFTFLSEIARKIQSFILKILNAAFDKFTRALLDSINCKNLEMRRVNEYVALAEAIRRKRNVSLEGYEADQRGRNMSE